MFIYFQEYSNHSLQLTLKRTRGIATTVLLGKVHLLWQGGDEDIEGGLREFLDTRKGDSEKIRGSTNTCILQNQQEGGWGS